MANRSSLILLALMLAGCTKTITLSDGENRCEYQSRTALDAESVQTIRAIVVDLASGVRREMITPPAAPSPTSMDCEGRVCMSMSQGSCVIQVK